VPFAIVLDNEVISAPVIREPITGGSGQISGNFTVQQANDLAILLRAGALPAPLTVVEERTVGPGLGQDSIEKGELAAYVGSILVIVFMLLTYRLFGVFANIAVAINVAMIFGILSLLNATLTLPGIAGVVLTVGIAVDSNVLIYERIREELRAGRNAISAIDAGFRRWRPSWTPTSPPSLPQPCCSTSAPGRFAASPSPSASASSPQCSPHLR
jgi:preprotein translocase subunit SecD